MGLVNMTQNKVLDFYTLNPISGFQEVFFFSLSFFRKKLQMAENIF